jgi:hypothetical protein
MLHYFKFRSDLPAPVPARATYVKRSGGRGWPEHCPPLRAANAFGWDVLAAFDMKFARRRDGSWRLAREVEVTSDWGWAPRGGQSLNDARPLTQKNAWFWDENQTVPHVITPDVYARIRNQVKVSTFLYLATDPGELLHIGDVPNQDRPFRAFSALVETDRYPASYPWHCVLELDPKAREVVIPNGTPICRLAIVRRGSYVAREMRVADFDRFFDRGQRWLARHGKGARSEMMDITGAYARLERASRFEVRPARSRR